MIATQNVDGLHKTGGAQHVLHRHGTLAGAFCATCSHRRAAADKRCKQTNPALPAGRRNVVWFGEMPYFMEDICVPLAATGIFATIGTSGVV